MRRFVRGMKVGGFTVLQSTFFFEERFSQAVKMYALMARKRSALTPLPWIQGWDHSGTCS